MQDNKFITRAQYQGGWILENLQTSVVSQMERPDERPDDILRKIVQNMEKVIIGKRRTVELVLLSLISGGHVLIEDIPGVGKTSLVSALAKSIDCGFKRIQFTPDTMPSDVTGFSIYNQKSGEFEFRPGAAMSNFVLADEINRASAKTQAALLEMMEEKQVTVDAHTYEMDEPFIVLATENPIEYLGTYPLPEAQIDRFLMKVSLGYPSLEDEMQVVENGNKVKKALRPVATGQDILDIRKKVEQVRVDRQVLRYLTQLVAETRRHPDVELGSSPRGSIALHRVSQAYALYQGRGYVLPDDVKAMAPYVLAHRIILNHPAKIARKSGWTVVEDVLKKVAVPIGQAVPSAR